MRSKELIHLCRKSCKEIKLVRILETDRNVRVQYKCILYNYIFKYDTQQLTYKIYICTQSTRKAIKSKHMYICLSHTTHIVYGICTIRYFSKPLHSVYYHFELAEECASSNMLLKIKTVGG